MVRELFGGTVGGKPRFRLGGECMRGGAGYLAWAFVLLVSSSFLRAGDLTATVDLNYGCKYTVVLKKNGDIHKDHAGVSNNHIRVCGGYTYEFEYTAIPGPDFEVVAPSPNPKTVTVMPDVPEETKTIGEVTFKHKDGKEQNFSAPVTIQIRSITLSEAGRTDEEFSGSVDAADIEARFKKMVGSIKIDKPALLKLLEDAIKKAIDKLPDPPLIDVPALAQSLVDKALDQVAAGIDKFNAAVDAAVKKAATDLKAALDKASPTVEFAGNYEYKCGFRDPGTEGWTLSPLEIGKIKALSGEGKLDYVLGITVACEPLGVGATVSFNVEFHAALSANGTFTAKHPTGPSPKDRPVTTVGATPGMDVELAVTGAAGVGLIVEIGAGATIPFEFDPVSAELEAGKTTKKTKKK